ncbi:protein tyrosine kinase [Teladorsagia circumcincta]|uniref:receptor protein-tyrosine kinase n=1 Tax=Teladorsagia circumcincta TaxID=45464 RepID=A0A2G9UZC1_TELCI|nr:protein tyrosine kinase [Teladorsagia circumcincta]
MDHPGMRLLMGKLKYIDSEAKRTLRWIDEVFELCEGGELLSRLRDTSKPVPLVTTLLDYCIQVVKALTFLESKHYVHRDVAARNILLSKDEKVVKLCDFGLMRSLKENERAYVMHAQNRVPFSWCPPESLRHRKFSHASDVWAFGVTAWEIFTLGEDPWIGCRAIDVLKRLDAGERLEKPRFCTQQIYDLVVLCWNIDPELRPKFSLLRTLLLGAEFNVAEVRDATQSGQKENMLEMSLGDKIIVIENSTQSDMLANVSAPCSAPHVYPTKALEDPLRIDWSEDFDAAAFDETFSPRLQQLNGEVPSSTRPRAQGKKLDQKAQPNEISVADIVKRLSDESAIRTRDSATLLPVPQPILHSSATGWTLSENESLKPTTSLVPTPVEPVGKRATPNAGSSTASSSQSRPELVKGSYVPLRLSNNEQPFTNSDMVNRTNQPTNSAIRSDRVPETKPENALPKRNSSRAPFNFVAPQPAQQRQLPLFTLTNNAPTAVVSPLFHFGMVPMAPLDPGRVPYTSGVLPPRLGPCAPFRIGEGEDILQALDPLAAGSRSSSSAVSENTISRAEQMEILYADAPFAEYVSLYKLGRELVIACSSCGSTLAHQFESFRRHTSLSGFQTLCLPATIVKMFNEPKVLLVDVVDNGILPQADEGSEVVLVDDCIGASLPELCCSLNAHREVESCAEESMVRSRVELRNNSDVGQAKPSIEDDVDKFGT